MDNRTVGIMIIGCGLLLAALGLLVAAGWLSWLGRLPGDIRYESGSTRVYIPITSMLLISVVLSGLLAIARRLFS